ncbi:unnamed protein product, partial [Mycena citricolor]
DKLFLTGFRENLNVQAHAWTFLYPDRAAVVFCHYRRLDKSHPVFDSERGLHGPGTTRDWKRSSTLRNLVVRVGRLGHICARPCALVRGQTPAAVSHARIDFQTRARSGSRGCLPVFAMQSADKDSLGHHLRLDNNFSPHSSRYLGAGALTSPSGPSDPCRLDSPCRVLCIDFTSNPLMAF